MHNTPEHDAPMQSTASLPAKRRITLTVNGAAKQVDVAPWTTLLDALREYLELTGTKKGVTTGSAGLARCWWMAGASSRA
jgi:xanthine dehydrogenase YagT iron-sulfur-binding subunit